MSTPEDVTALFDKASAALAPIVGLPTDDDVVRLRKTITDVLLSMHIGGGKQCLLGLIVPDTTYRAKHGAAFNPMTNPIDDYDSSILPNANNNDRVRAERIWTAKLDRQRLIRTAECKACNLIISAVEDMWILPLKSATTFYNKVVPRDILDHVTTNSGGLDTTNIVTLQATMLSWWAEDPRVPEYINRLEDAQKKASRGPLPITDDWLSAVTSASFLSLGSFPCERPEWDGLPTSAKTWKKWKETFLVAHTGLERKQRAAKVRGDNFGSMHASATSTAVNGALHTLQM